MEVHYRVNRGWQKSDLYFKIILVVILNIHCGTVRAEQRDKTGLLQ